MPLTLVLGPANSAKAGEVLAAYTAAAHHGALLVVPTATDAEHYGRELAGEGAILGSVLTFFGLSGEIAKRAGYTGRRLSTLQRQRVLKRVVAAADLSVLAESAASAGFADAAGNLISELQRALISPERFAHAVERWSAEDRRRAPYAREVAALYRGYATELKRIGWVDSELFAWQALDALRAAPGRWGNLPVFFYGFDDLNPLERDAVETLSRVVGTAVTVSLSYEAGRAAFASRAEAVEELRPLAERVLELPALDEYYAPAAREALHHLERSLFESGVGRVDPGRAVRLLEAGGERAEAELIAAEVLERLRAGVAAEEIVVVSRSAERAAALFERVFAQYEIALASTRSVPFGSTPLGRGLLALCRCALTADAGAEDLLRYLRAPGVLDRPEIADALEFEIRREGLTSVAQARERLGWTLEEIDALRDADDPASEVAWHARRLFAAPHRGRAHVLGADEELDARALVALLAALDELDVLSERLSAKELLELFGTLAVPAGVAARPGAVLLADPLEIRARRFRTVFICGLQEGAFPLRVSPEPFLSDERRRELTTASGLRLGATEDSLARERYLFYASVSRATDEVVLSYRSSDEEGNLELRSPFLADIEELFVEDWPERRRRRLLADVVWPADDAPTERELERSLAASGAAPAGEPPAPARMLGEAARAHVRHTEIVSGGALESYADCPVRWLVERELAPERFGPDPEPLARGSYMHAVLEAVIRRLEGPVTAESLPLARTILDEVLAAIPMPVAVGRPQPVRSAAATAIRADLERYLEHEAGDSPHWQPRGLELRFGFAGEEGSLPPLRLDDVQVRGVIDRVDVDPGEDRAIVRDYKSGRQRPEHQGGHWRDDRQLQVALYMLAVRQLLGLDPVAGLYQPLGGNDLRARGMFLRDAPVGGRLYGTDAREQSELDEALRDAASRAAQLAGRLRAGELTPCPQTCSRDGCRYPGICRSQ
jgi:ATP-dependent helicase/DNAse subunit B